MGGEVRDGARSVKGTRNTREMNAGHGLKARALAVRACRIGRDIILRAFAGLLAET
jgi:hypothetical protein